jgi:hypothetical protein
MRDVGDRFWELAIRWHNETAAYSLSQRISHPAAEEIIKMGPEAVPYILRAYDIMPDWWSLFLDRIMGTRPPTSWYEAGVFDSVRDAWLRWTAGIGIVPAPFPADRAMTAIQKVVD